jgi:hypothetical protein
MERMEKEEREGGVSWKNKAKKTNGTKSDLSST